MSHRSVGLSEVECGGSVHDVMKGVKKRDENKLKNDGNKTALDKTLGESSEGISQREENDCENTNNNHNEAL